MTILQHSLLGDDARLEVNMTNEVRTIIEQYPHAADHLDLLTWIFLKRQCKWLAQLDEAKTIEMKAALRGIESLRRRAQEFKSAAGASR